MTDLGNYSMPGWNESDGRLGRCPNPKCGKPCMPAATAESAGQIFRCIRCDHYFCKTCGGLARKGAGGKIRCTTPAAHGKSS